MGNGGLLQLNAKNYICFRGLALERLLSCCPTEQVQLPPHPLHAFHVWATFRGEGLLALLKEVEINALFEPMHYSKCSQPMHLVYITMEKNTDALLYKAHLRKSFWVPNWLNFSSYTSSNKRYFVFMPCPI